jgi:hypothetical protein
MKSIAVKSIAFRRIGVAASLVATAMVALAWRGDPVMSIPVDSLREPPCAIRQAAPAITQVSMRNVNFYVTRDAALRIRHLRGEMRPLRGEMVVFDDKNSFVIKMAYAEIGLSGPDLSNLMNSVVFAYRGAPLRRMRVRTSGTLLVQSGILHKFVDMPFEITSEPSVTPEGLIRLHPVKTRILGVDGNALMRAFGLSLEKILDVRKAKGVSVRGNDLFLDPVALLPPPAIEGRLASIRIERDQLVQVFGTPSASTPLPLPDSSARAYMFYKGGTLRFGKLLMTDADMQIVALSNNQFFGFDLDRYKQQLVAGYSRTLPDLGLEVYMASVETLGTGKTVVATVEPRK